MLHDRRRPIALAITPDYAERAAVRAALAGRFDVVCAPGYPEAWLILRGRTEVDLILADTDADGEFTWKELLEEIAGDPHVPAVILISRKADDRLWVESLQAGVFDLLLKPFTAAELSRSAGAACASRFALTAYLTLTA